MAGGDAPPRRRPVAGQTCYPHRPLPSSRSPVTPSNALWPCADQLSSASPAVLDWLFDERSLTRRLTALADDAFRAEPPLEGWQTLRDDKCQGFDVPLGSNGWTREVYPHGHDRLWVFARSMVARSALEGSGLDLVLFSTRSLDESLFSDSAFERGPIEVCRHPTAGLPAEVRVEGLWGRCSRFSRGAFGVLVAEVSLPGLWDQVGTADV